MIKLVTDSTAYLPDSLAQQHDIRVVPLSVHFGEEEFREGVELSNEEFYARLKAAPRLPTTSQPSAGQFHEVFKELTDSGHEIVTVTISSKLSGTWNSATAAAGMIPDGRISVVDSLSTAVGLQLMVMEAAEAIASGASREQVVERIERMRGEVYVLFVVDTLEALAKGGRIGNAKALLGTVLKVKPILILHNGAIEPLEQVRSKNKAVARMLDLIQERWGRQGGTMKAAVTHALALDEALAVRQELMARFGCQEPLLTDLGPVIGAHTGPGVLAVATHAS